MGAAILIKGACGCLNRIDKSVVVNDAVRTFSLNVKQVEAMLVNGEASIPINDVFDDKTDLLTYLNDVFKIVNGWMGIFVDLGTDIEYTNPEGFTTLEIMSIAKPATKVFVMGTPPQMPNVAYVTVANGASITHASLAGEISAVRVSSANLEPLDVNGWEKTGATTITFNGPDLSVENSIIYVDLIETI